MFYSRRKGWKKMGLLQEWRDYAYKFDDRTKEGQQFWLTYFNIEKGIYDTSLQTASKNAACTIIKRPQSAGA